MILKDDGQFAVGAERSVPFPTKVLMGFGSKKTKKKESAQGCLPSPTATAVETRPKGRIASLDVLRGIAILLVMGRHHSINPRTAGFLFVPAAAWQRFGWTGVDLFFVLSGFLVGGLLVKEILERGELHVPRFLIRRGLKIWPLYYIFLAWIFLKFMITTPGPPAAVAASYWPRFWPCLANIQNYFDLPRLHLWSLGVEEHFYLLLPLLLKWLTPNAAALKRATLAVPLVGIFVACLGMRTWVAVTQAPSIYHDYYTHLRLDSLAFGFLLAWVYHTRRPTWNRISQNRGWLVAGGLLAIAPAGILPGDSALTLSAGLTLLYLGYGALLIAFLSAEPATILGRFIHSQPGRVLAFVGLYSYPIYLWHVDLEWPLDAAISRGWTLQSGALNWLTWTAIYLTLGVLVGMIVAKLVEIPTLRLRDRLYPPRAAAVDAVEVVGQLR